MFTFRANKNKHTKPDRKSEIEKEKQTQKQERNLTK
jgi:hypothetical protein